MTKKFALHCKLKKKIIINLHVNGYKKKKLMFTKHNIRNVCEDTLVGACVSVCVST